MASPPARPTCRLLPQSNANGAWQMAADEAMLETASQGIASLRFYQWSEPTLSLGYFQPQSVRQSDALLERLPFVRRATGGATLVHHHELTYGLALPNGEPWQSRGESWLARMHSILAAALARLGATVDIVGPENRRKLGEALCFLDQTPCDLVCHGHKVVGSAQRKHRSALLQHGSILIARSEYTPALPGLHELDGFPTNSFQAVASAILLTFHAATNWHLERCDWTAAEAERREELILTKYTRPSWNDKR
jgi:lipoyl(octanoyl) transferase